MRVLVLTLLVVAVVCETCDEEPHASLEEPHASLSEWLEGRAELVELKTEDSDFDVEEVALLRRPRVFSQSKLKPPSLPNELSCARRIRPPFDVFVGEDENNPIKSSVKSHVTFEAELNEFLNYRNASSKPWASSTVLRGDFANVYYVPQNDMLSEDASQRPTRVLSLLWITHPGAIASFHNDHTHNFVTQLKGTKRFYLISPLFFEFMRPYPELHVRARNSQNEEEESLNLGSKKVEVFWTDLKANETLYLPPYWFHRVAAMGKEISVGMTVWSFGSEKYPEQYIKESGILEELTRQNVFAFLKGLTAQAASTMKDDLVTFAWVLDYVVNSQYMASNDLTKAAGCLDFDAAWCDEDSLNASDGAEALGKRVAKAALSPLRMRPESKAAVKMMLASVFEHTLAKVYSPENVCVILRCALELI